jgi:caspase domain-containing protein
MGQTRPRRPPPQRAYARPVLPGMRGVKILILDACRNNPLADRLMLRAINRDVVPSRGLARIEAPRGMVIAYATQSNQVAVDGIGRNSPFTKALLTEMERPGLEIATLFRRVAANVDRATGGRQLPELSISMSGEFYLNTRDTDVQAWAKLRGSTDQRQLRNFIAVYPDSPLTSDVRERIVALERLEGEQEATRAQAERERFQRERLSREQAEREQLEEERHAREESEQRI